MTLDWSLTEISTQRRTLQIQVTETGWCGDKKINMKQTGAKDGLIIDKLHVQTRY